MSPPRKHRESPDHPGNKGGSGNQITAYLKKIGFATPYGTPTDLYKKFRNSATEGWAAAQALKTGYAPLYVRNEYIHKLPDNDLKGLIVEETGAEQAAARQRHDPKAFSLSLSVSDLFRREARRVILCQP